MFIFYWENQYIHINGNQYCPKHIIQIECFILYDHSLLESYALLNAVNKKQRQLFIEGLIQCLFKLFIKGNIINLDLFIRIECLYFVQEGLSILISIAEFICQNKMLVLSNKFLQTLSRKGSTVLRHFSIEFFLGYQIFANIQPSNQFSIRIYLRICWPSAVVSQPISHILISQDIVEGKADLLVLEKLEKSFSKPAFWGFYCSLDEQNDLRFVQNTLYFWMPNRLLFLKSFSKRDCFLRQGIIYTSHILCRHFFYNLFVSLSEDNGWGLGDIVLFKGLRCRLIGYEVVFDVLMIPEDGNGGLQVGLKLEGLRIGLGVEGKDEQRSEIVEESPGENLIRLESLYLSHNIIIKIQIL